MSVSPIGALSDVALQAAPATKARGYWATVGRRILRDKVSIGGAGIGNSIVSLTIVFMPQITRVAESVTTGVRNMDFVEAARASGAGPLTIMRVHMLGNVLGPIFVYATGLISVSMILAAGLSFLGLGTKPPEPEWGLMLKTLRTAIYVNPWVAELSGDMLFVVSILFYFFCVGIRSAMDI